MEQSKNEVSKGKNLCPGELNPNHDKKILHDRSVLYQREEISNYREKISNYLKWGLVARKKEETPSLIWNIQIIFIQVHQVLVQIFA